MKNITVLNVMHKKVDDMPQEVIEYTRQKEDYISGMPLVILRVTDTHKHGLIFIPLLYSDGINFMQLINKCPHFSLRCAMNLMIEPRCIYHTILNVNFHLPGSHHLNHLNCTVWIDTEDAIKKEYLKIAL